MKLNFDIEIIGFGEKQLVMSIKKYIDKNNLDVNISPAFGDMKKKVYEFTWDNFAQYDGGFPYVFEHLLMGYHFL